MGHLSQNQIGNGTGLFNLMRNIGGSVGIAFVATLLSRDAQKHQAMMVSHLTPFDPAYRAALTGIKSMLSSQAGNPGAAEKSLQIVYDHLLQQARLWAFVDNFQIFGIACACCIPIVFFFKRTKGKNKVAMH